MKIAQNRFITIGSLAILVAVAMVWHFWQKPGRHFQSMQNEANAVEVASVTELNIPIVVKSVGVLQAVRQINVSSQNPNVVTAINYEPGTLVQAGTPLIQLDDRLYKAQLDSANAELKLSDMQNSRSILLAKQGALSKADLDQAQANFSKAKAQVAMSQTLLAETTIRAPFTGYVGPKNISIGDYVSVGQVLTTLTDRSQLLVNYSLPEKWAIASPLKLPIIKIKFMKVKLSI
jgi:RND family efflux transporter MFP subunit